MKKFLLFLVIAVLASTAFAQGFSITGQASTGIDRDFEGYVYWNAWPVIGMEIDLGNVDILAGVRFWVHSLREDKGTVNDWTTINWSFGFYGGIAPEVDITQKASLSFPILFEFNHIGYKNKPKNGTPLIKKWGYNRIAIDLGARMYYNVTEKIGVFGGFKVSALTLYTQTKASYTSGSTFKTGDINLLFFRMGTIDLGVKFTF